MDADAQLAARLQQQEYEYVSHGQSGDNGWDDGITLDDSNDGLPKSSTSLPIVRDAVPVGSLRRPGEQSIVSRKMNLCDPTLEIADPHPDIRALFMEFDRTFFGARLSAVEVRWSPRMTLCAGLCLYEHRGRYCSVRLSEPLLKLRPRSDTINTLLHEMIHAYLFITERNTDRSGHGPNFLALAKHINGAAGTNITVYHTFHDEVDSFRKHVWKCSGPCAARPPYFGLVKRAMNRAPSALDPWWAQHAASCGGSYAKIAGPPPKEKGAGKGKKLGGGGVPSAAAAAAAKGSGRIASFFPVVLDGADSDGDYNNAPRAVAAKGSGAAEGTKGTKSHSISGTVPSFSSGKQAGSTTGLVGKLPGNTRPPLDDEDAGWLSNFGRGSILKPPPMVRTPAPKPVLANAPAGGAASSSVDFIDLLDDDDDDEGVHTAGAKGSDAYAVTASGMGSANEPAPLSSSAASAVAAPTRDEMRARMAEAAAKRFAAAQASAGSAAALPASSLSASIASISSASSSSVGLGLGISTEPSSKRLRILSPPRPGAGAGRSSSAVVASAGSDDGGVIELGDDDDEDEVLAGGEPEDAAAQALLDELAAQQELLSDDDEEEDDDGGEGGGGGFFGAGRR